MGRDSCHPAERSTPVCMLRHKRVRFLNKLKLLKNLRTAIELWSRNCNFEYLFRTKHRKQSRKLRQERFAKNAILDEKSCRTNVVPPRNFLKAQEHEMAALHFNKPVFNMCSISSINAKKQPAAALVPSLKKKHVN